MQDSKEKKNTFFVVSVDFSDENVAHSFFNMLESCGYRPRIQTENFGYLGARLKEKQNGRN